MKFTKIITGANLFILCLFFSAAPIMAENNGSNIKIHYLKNDFSISELNNTAWADAVSVSIQKYWSGEKAPSGRHFAAGLLWSNLALYVRFEANQNEPLIVAEQPDVSKKTRGLWDRDVCEIFIAPDKNARNRYFEFEIAPTGEWIDLDINWKQSKRETDWEYASEMESAAVAEKSRVVMAIKIPWKALGKTPKIGDIWLGNLFRCIGKDPTRGYLSWQATKTKQPSFHVPSKFGELIFVK